MTASVREALREHTDPAHRRIDAMWSGRRLDRRRDYAAFLCATAAALIPLEAALEAGGIGDAVADWALRRRADCLALDLAGLEAVAPAVAPPRLAGVPEMIGALYVLEGSRLGGVMLARAVACSDDSAVLQNRRFLGHGDTGRLWRSFVAILDRRPPDELPQLCAGALCGFGLFERAARSILMEN